MPSRRVGTEGSLDQAESGPVGTTSVWPAKTSSLPSAAVPRRIAHRLLTRAVSGPNGNEVQRKPTASRRAATIDWQPPSSGVTERQPISCSARESVADIGAVGAGRNARSEAAQVRRHADDFFRTHVDRDLGE